MAVVMLMLSCHTKTDEEIANIEMMSVSEPAACMMAPIKESVRFVPPVIKDDAVEKESAAKPATKPFKKIIKDGSISIKVNYVEMAKRRMDTVIKAFDAYYEQEEFENYENRSSYQLKIRIPSKQFEKFLKATENGTGELMSKNINARDVTEEYIDNKIRLESKHLFRKRYNELLTKAGKVVDILAIEENIRTLQEEIESSEGQLKFMDDQVAYSTLDVTLFKLKETLATPEKKETFGQMVGISLGNGWDSVITFVLWSIKQWPWLVVILVFVLGLKQFLKRRKKSV